MIKVIAQSGELTSPKFAEAFAAGCGGQVVDKYQGGVWAGFGSPQNWESLQDAIKSGYDWYYGDHGYFGRGKYYKITKNAYQHSGLGIPDYDRLKFFYEDCAAWNKDGRHILICAQSQNHYDRFGVPNWVEDTKKEIQKYTDRPIVIRKKTDRLSLFYHLKDAFCTASHSSASIIHGLMHGVPAFCTHQCAASVVALSDLSAIESPFYPDNRMEWAAVLAANQWTLEEITETKAWRKLNEKV